MANIVDNLLSEKHGYGWNATQPPGTEGDNLMKVLETFAHVMSRSLQNHVTDGYIGGKIGYEDAYLFTICPKIGTVLKILMYTVKHVLKAISE